MLTPSSLCMGQPGSRLSNLVGGRFRLLQVKAGNTGWDEASVSYIAGFWVIISTLSFSGQACLLNGGDPNTGSPVGTPEGSLGSLARAADPSSVWFSGEGGRSHLTNFFQTSPLPALLQHGPSHSLSQSGCSWRLLSLHSWAVLMTCGGRVSPSPGLLLEQLRGKRAGQAA